MSYRLLGTAEDDIDRILLESARRVVYRIGRDGVVEIIGVAHDRMLLARASRRMQREAGG